MQYKKRHRSCPYLHVVCSQQPFKSSNASGSGKKSPLQHYVRPRTPPLRLHESTVGPWIFTYVFINTVGVLFPSHSDLLLFSQRPVRSHFECVDAADIFFFFFIFRFVRRSRCVRVCVSSCWRRHHRMVTDYVLDSILSSRAQQRKYDN